MNNFIGKLIIVSAPSGSGKTTLVKELLQARDDLSFSVSCTTRPPRATETEGKDYYFLTIDEFQTKVDNNQFIEWEEVYEDALYGTLKSEIERIWKEGKHVIFDIDVAGAVNLKEYYKDQALAIYIKAPSVKEIEKRLRDRQTESEEKIQTRLEKVKQEINYIDDFDVVIENNDLPQAKKEIIQTVDEFIKQT